MGKHVVGNMRCDTLTEREIERDAADLCRLAEEVFPLTLAPFEEYMWAESRVGNDMSFFLKVEVEGHVDHSRLQSAVRLASYRHPLTRAILKRCGLRTWQWHLAGNQQPRVAAWPESFTSPAWPRPLNLEQEPGIRGYVRQTEAKATLCFQFHHACCDGVGAFQWLGDVLAFYGIETGGPETPRVVPVDLQRLVHRGRARFGSFRRLRWLAEHFREGRKLWLQPPRPLQRDTAHQRTSLDEPAPFPLTSFVFSEEETRELRGWVQSRQATMNDLLLLSLFRTIVAWNSEDRTDPWYRINMPTSLRERADSKTPATNLMSMTFLNRRRSVVAQESSQLLEGIVRESNDIKRNSRGTLLLEGLALGAAVPGLLSGPLKMPLCMSTAVLTNVGDPSRRLTARFPRREGRLVAGNLVVESIEGVPPLRARTHAAVGVTTYCGRLSLSLMMTPAEYSAPSVDRFLGIFVKSIRESANLISVS